MGSLLFFPFFYYLSSTTLSSCDKSCVLRLILYIYTHRDKGTPGLSWTNVPPNYFLRNTSVYTYIYIYKQFFSIKLHFIPLKISLILLRVILQPQTFLQHFYKLLMQQINTSSHLHPPLFYLFRRMLKSQIFLQTVDLVGNYW